MITSGRADPSSATALTTYACLALQFRMSAADPEIAAELAQLYAACRAVGAPESVPAVLEVGVAPGVRTVRFVGGATADAVVPEADRNALLLAAMQLIDGAAIEASAGELLLVHASASVSPGGPVLFVGPSGAGKSTLAAALAMSGWPYAGDEAVGLDAEATALCANPKPVKLDRNSRRALHLDLDVDIDGAPDGEALVAPHTLGPVIAPGPVAAPVAVVGITYRAGARAHVVPMTRGETAEAVADQCFNFARGGGRALDTVAALARSAPGVRLEFGDLDGALARLEELFA